MDWLATLARPRRRRSPRARVRPCMQHGTMTLRYYAPRGRDPQTPHAQDEIYVVVAGSGAFALGRDEDALERRRFGPGDAIFAPGRLGAPLRGLHRRLRHLGRVLGPQRRRGRAALMVPSRAWGCGAIHSEGGEAPARRRPSMVISNVTRRKMPATSGRRCARRNGGGCRARGGSAGWRRAPARSNRSASRRRPPRRRP